MPIYYQYNTTINTLMQSMQQEGNSFYGLQNNRDHDNYNIDNGAGGGGSLFDSGSFGNNSVRSTDSFSRASPSSSTLGRDRYELHVVTDDGYGGDTTAPPSRSIQATTATAK